VGMSTRHSRLLLLPCVAVLATALVGCSSDGGSDATGDPTSSGTSTTAAATPSSGPEVDAVCSAYQDSATTLGAVKTHLKDHDTAQARVSLADADVALGVLTKSVAALPSDLRTLLKPRTQEIAVQVQALDDKSISGQQLKAGLSVIELEAQRLATDMRSNLDCQA
jgi:hypothetical protein